MDCSTSEAILCPPYHGDQRCKGWTCTTSRQPGRLHQAQSLCTLRVGHCWRGALLSNLSFWKPDVSTAEGAGSLQKIGSEYQVSSDKCKRALWVILDLAWHPPTVTPFPLIPIPSPGQLGPQKNNQVQISNFPLNCCAHSVFQNPVNCLKVFLQKAAD